MQYSVVHFPARRVMEAARLYQAPYRAGSDVAIGPHFTLHPPFESARSVEDLAGVLEEICSHTRPFKARISGFDTFFGRKYVLFMRLADESKMFHLLEKIDKAITELDWKDVLDPGTKPRPHLTIGFFDKREEVEEAEAKLVNEKVRLEWRVDEIDLVAEVKPCVLQSVRTFALGGSRGCANHRAPCDAQP